MPAVGQVIAIIDDDGGVREAVQHMLAARGFGTELYASAEEFITAAAISEAVCLVLDIQLGDISGVELARHLCATGFKFPIIFMTGSQSEALRRQAMAVGCVAFLNKPFREAELFHAIMKA